MTTTIAISGKGGSGKTTLAAMMIRTLLDHSTKGVLAVDADPNACLGITLGLEPKITVAQIREKARQKKPSNAGMDRVRAFEYDIQQAVTEGPGFDLLTMGHPEGPSCYCSANNLLRQFLDTLTGSYDYIVTDNEAGMEHLSRRTTNNVDLLCIVAEPSPIGVRTAQRIVGLTEKLPIIVKKTGLLWNRSDTAESIDQIKTIACIPNDNIVTDSAMQGQTIFDIPNKSPAFSAVRKMLEHQFNLNESKSIY